MTYRHAETFLFSRHQMNIKLNLECILHLLDGLDHPEKTFRSIHIAGTNGKGSTAAMMEAVLRDAGYKTGLYISPHLIDMRERIQVQGKPISRERMLGLFRKTKPFIEGMGASFFEAITAMGFRHFADEHVDIAVIETGLGGRLDATNVLSPVLTVITDIGLDHTNILGTRIAQIAEEKTGILKSGVPCITGASHKEALRVIREAARNRGVPLRTTKDCVKIYPGEATYRGSTFDIQLPHTFYDNLFLGLAGAYQKKNCAVALLGIEELVRLGWKIPETVVRKGLEKVRWPGRLDLLQKNPGILVDAAHNPMGIRQLVEALKSLYKYKRLILIFGVLRDKNYRNMISMILPLSDTVILTCPTNERALDPGKLAALRIFKGRSVYVKPEISEAYSLALTLAGQEDMICGAGSIYFIGEMMRLWKESKRRSI